MEQPLALSDALLRGRLEALSIAYIGAGLITTPFS